MTHNPQLLQRDSSTTAGSSTSILMMARGLQTRRATHGLQHWQYFQSISGRSIFEL